MCTPCYSGTMIVIKNWKINDCNLSLFLPESTENKRVQRIILSQKQTIFLSRTTRWHGHSFLAGCFKVCDKFYILMDCHKVQGNNSISRNWIKNFEKGTYHKPYIYDQAHHHINFGTSCWKWANIPYFWHIMTGLQRLTVLLEECLMICLSHDLQNLVFFPHPKNVGHFQSIDAHNPVQ